MTVVSANGPGPEWDAECDVGSTWPDPGGWISDGFECEGTLMHDPTPHFLSLETLRSHNGTSEYVSSLVS